MTDQFSRYFALVLHLAKRMTGDDADAPVPPATPGQSLPMTLGLPPARRLLDDIESRDQPAAMAVPAWTESLHQLASTVGEARDATWPRCVTLTGQSRPVYFPLLIHLYLQAWRMEQSTLTQVDSDACSRSITTLLDAMTDERADLDLATTLWRALCRIEAADLLGERQTAASSTAAIADVERLLSDADVDPLHPLTSEDQLDAWTYQELAGLHALGWLTRRVDRPHWRQRLAEAALYHLDHTQPDYTTYEPWGLFVFAENGTTAIFADQQLHDAQTNLNLVGRDAGLMAGLLLSDAACAMTPGSSHR